jgi:hypothetical protein
MGGHPPLLSTCMRPFFFPTCPSCLPSGQVHVFGNLVLVALRLVRDHLSLFYTAPTLQKAHRTSDPRRRHHSHSGPWPWHEPPPPRAGRKTKVMGCLGLTRRWRQVGHYCSTFVLTSCFFKNLLLISGFTCLRLPSYNRPPSITKCFWVMLHSTAGIRRTYVLAIYKDGGWRSGDDDDAVVGAGSADGSSTNLPIIIIFASTSAAATATTTTTATIREFPASILPTTVTEPVHSTSRFIKVA